MEEIVLSEVLSFFEEIAFVAYSIRQYQQSQLGITRCYLITSQPNAS